MGIELNLWIKLGRTEILTIVSPVIFSFLDIQRRTIIQSGLKNSLCDERGHVNQTRKKKQKDHNFCWEQRKPS